MNTCRTCCTTAYLSQQVKCTHLVASNSKVRSYRSHDASVGAAIFDECGAFLAVLLPLCVDGLTQPVLVQTEVTQLLYVQSV